MCNRWVQRYVCTDSKCSPLSEVLFVAGVQRGCLIVMSLVSVKHLQIHVCVFDTKTSIILFSITVYSLHKTMGVWIMIYRLLMRHTEFYQKVKLGSNVTFGIFKSTQKFLKRFSKFNQSSAFNLWKRTNLETFQS